MIGLMHLGLAALAGAVVAVIAVTKWRRSRPGLDETLDDAQVETDGGQALVDLPPPDIRTAWGGTLQEIWRFYREHRKRRKLAGEGYVQWYLIDDSYPTPQYVKPTADGGGTPELEHDGDRYLFPRKAMLPSEQQGMWTVVHKKGDAMPINLDEPGRPSLEADEVAEYLELKVSSTPPSFLGSLDLDPEDLLTYTVFAIIAFAILKQFGIL